MLQHGWTLKTCSVNEDRHKRSHTGDFPGGPAVKTLCSQCRGPVFSSYSIPTHAIVKISCSITKIPCAATKTQCSQTNNSFFFKSHTVWLYLCMLFRKGKYIETESKSEVARGWEEVEGAVTANEYRVSLGRWWKCPEIREWWWGFLGGASGKRICLPMQGDAGDTGLIPK